MHQGLGKTESLQILAGFGFGASSIALFARVAGGIYTKAADVGADLVGKVEAGIDEDDPHNPAVIADNVGDNVGDVAGMGSDLFGSLAESTCAALVIASTSSDLLDAGWAALLFPLTISAAGMVVCMACSFIATDLKPVVREADVEEAATARRVPPPPADRKKSRLRDSNTRPPAYEAGAITTMLNRRNN